MAGPGAESSLADFRKDITVDMFNEAGQKVISYQVFRCWVSEYQSLRRFRLELQCSSLPAHQAGKRRLAARSLGYRA